MFTIAILYLRIAHGVIYSLPQADVEQGYESCEVSVANKVLFFRFGTHFLLLICRVHATTT